MDVSELNIQESIIMFMTPHEEEESGKVCQDDTNMEQVELSDIVPQNLESE
ncbi:9826_t:CDS:2, partial [Rhizophagus irregularis]